MDRQRGFHRRVLSSCGHKHLQTLPTAAWVKTRLLVQVVHLCPLALFYLSYIKQGDQQCVWFFLVGTRYPSVNQRHATSPPRVVSTVHPGATTQRVREANQGPKEPTKEPTKETTEPTKEQKYRKTQPHVTASAACHKCQRVLWMLRQEKETLGSKMKSQARLSTTLSCPRLHQHQDPHSTRRAPDTRMLLIVGSQAWLR